MLALSSAFTGMNAPSIGINICSGKIIHSDKTITYAMEREEN